MADDTQQPAQPPENPFARIERDAATAKDYKDHPENPFARIEQASAQGLNLDTEAPVGSPGFLGGMADVGRGLAHGAVVTLPQAVGQTAQNFGREFGSDTLSKWGKETADAADARDKAHPELHQSQVGQIAADDSAMSVRGGAFGAGDNTPLSTGPGLAGAAAGAAIGSVLPGAGTLAGAGLGYVVGSLASMPLFYGSQGQQSYEKIKAAQLKAGKSEQDAEAAATAGGRMSGTIEAGGEMLGEAIPFHQLLKPLAKPIAGRAVKSLFEGGLRRAAGTLFGTEASEIGTEMGQQAAEAAVEGHYGAGPGATWKDTASVIMPVALMTLLPGGLTVAHNFRTAHTMQHALTDPSADPEKRAAAAAMVFHSLKDEQPEVAQGFDAYSAAQIAQGKPIEVDKPDAFYTAQVETPDYAAAQQQLETPTETPDYAAAQQQLDAGDTPDYDAAQQQLAAREYEAWRAEQLNTPAARAGIDASRGGLSNAAAIAINTGASAAAAANRQSAVDQETHAADQQAADAAAKPGEEAGPVAPPPGAGPISGALFPFGTPGAALAHAELRTAQTGIEHYTIPHPAVHDKFAVVPRTPADSQEIEAAPPPQDSNVEEIEAAPPPPEDRPPGVKLRPPEEIEAAPPPDETQDRGTAPESAAATPPQSAGPTQAETGSAPSANSPSKEDTANGDVPVPTAADTQDEGRGTSEETPPAVGPGQDVGDHPADEPGPEGGSGGGVRTAEGEGQGEGQGPVVGGAREPAGPSTPPVVTPGTVDEGAHDGASSPTNGKTATDNEILGGNAELGHINVHGLDISIENSEGSTRTDLHHVPPQWQTTMQAHYGYIKGTVGKDKDHIDAFVKPGTSPDHAGPLFVIDQPSADGSFDEHKVMIGYAGALEAVAAYKAHYPADHKVGPVTAATPEEFKAWLATGNTKQEFSKRTAPAPADTGGDITAGPREPRTATGVPPATPEAAEPEVDVKVIEAETGRQAIVKMKASEALTHYDTQLEKARGILECLHS